MDRRRFFMSNIHRNAKPFFSEGHRKTICLLVHGFTGSPSEMKLLGEYLRSKGYGVSAPLLSGHGTTPEEMILTGWYDWYGSVEKEYLRLSNKYPQSKIIPIGLSMGGTLVLHLASHYTLSGIVALCPGLYLRSNKAYMTPVLQYFKKYEHRNVTGNTKTIKNYDNNSQFYYDKTPIKSVASQLSLIKKVRKEITCINAPILIIQSKKDGTLNPQGAKKIYDNIASQEKKLVWLEKSGHIITLGPERSLVFQKTEDFLCNVCN